MPATDIYRLGSDRTTAMSRLFRRWKIELPDAALETPCQFALSQGLRCLGGEGALQTLRMHDRPFVLEVQDENSPRVRFLTILGLDASQLLLDLGDTQRPLPLEVLDRTSFGRFTLIWRPPAGGSRMVTEQAPPESIIWLRDRLNQLSNATLPDPDSPIFDQALRSRLIEFQNSRGLVADGIAGPNTLIQINTASAVPGTPTLAMTPR